MRVRIALEGMFGIGAGIADARFCRVDSSASVPRKRRAPLEIGIRGEIAELFDMVKTKIPEDAA